MFTEKYIYLFHSKEQLLTNKVLFMIEWTNYLIEYIFLNRSWQHEKKIHSKIKMTHVASIKKKEKKKMNKINVLEEKNNYIKIYIYFFVIIRILFHLLYLCFSFNQSRKIHKRNHCCLWTVYSFIPIILWKCFQHRFKDTFFLN